MSIDLDKYKGVFANVQESLNKMSDDIKKAEQYLLDNNPAIQYCYMNHISIFGISWKQYNKRWRLCGYKKNKQGGYKYKPIIEWDVENRKGFYDQIPNFFSDFINHLKNRKPYEYAK